MATRLRSTRFQDRCLPAAVARRHLQTACRLLPLLCLLLLPLTAGANDLRAVAFIPQWVPQAQFAGYYLAREKGFFKEAGLDVTILRGGPGAPPSEYLADGKAQFGSMFLSKGIQLRANGVKVVNICQLVQRSSLMLVAKTTSGIASPEDMNGKKVGLWEGEFDLQPQAFFKAYHLTIHPVRQTSSMTLFLRDGVDVVSAMWYNEYHRLLNSGLDPDELKTFFFSDYNLNFPEDGIYVPEAFYRQEPETCHRFVRAVLRGWRYAFAHPEETVDFLMHYDTIGRDSNRAHQHWMLDRMQDIIQPAGSEVPMGELQKTDYDRVAGELLRAGMIRQAPAFAEFSRTGQSHD